MSTDAKKMPSPISRLIEVMAADGNGNVKLAENVGKSVVAIGAALAAAGVAPSAMGLASTIGALTVDPNLPNMGAGAVRQV